MKLKAFALTVAALVASSVAFAANTKFCLAPTFGGSLDAGYITLSQRSATYKPSLDEECFEQWYTETAKDEAPTSVVGKIASIRYVYELALSTDIDLGGRTKDGCAVRFEPLGDGVSRMNGSGHTIKNLCVIRDESSNPDYVSAGFFEEGSYRVVHDLNFDSAYVRVASISSSESRAGVLFASSYADSVWNVKVSNSEVYGSIAGGLVGRSEGTLFLENVEEENVKVAFSKATTDYPEEALGSVYLGGLLGFGSAELVFHSVALRNVDVTSTEKIAGETFLGGQIGHLLVGYRAMIVNTYNTGSSISYNGPACAEGSDCSVKIGYLVGRMSYDDGTLSNYDRDALWIRFNYFVGEDSKAEEPFGLLERNGEIVENWNSPDYETNFAYNIRNAVDGIVENAVDEYFMNEDTQTYNAAVNGSLLKRDDFAAFLNETDLDFSKERVKYGVRKWSRKDNVNGGYPVFSDNALRTIYHVDFVAEYDVMGSLSSDELKIWQGSMSDEEMDGNPEMASRSFVMDYTGKIKPDAEWANYAKQVSAGKSYFWLYRMSPNSKETQTDFDVNRIYSDRAAYFLKQKMGKVNVVYQFCTMELVEDEQKNVCKEVAPGEGYFTTVPVSTYEGGDFWTVVPYLMKKQKDNFSDDAAESWFKHYPSYSYSLCDATGACTREPINSYYRTFGEVISEYFDGPLDFDTLFVQYQDDNHEYYNATYVMDAYGDANHEGLEIVPYYMDEKGKLVTTGETFYGRNWNENSPYPLGALDIRGILNQKFEFAPAYKLSYGEVFGTVIDSVMAIVLVTQNNNVSASLNEELQDNLSWIPVKDTVSALGDKESIYEELLNASESRNLSFVRFVKIPNGGTLDLSSLYSAVSFASKLYRQDSLMVAVRPIAHDIKYVVSFDVTPEKDELSMLFIGDSLIDKGAYPMVEADMLGNVEDDFTTSADLYRLDACFSGSWLPKKMDYNRFMQGEGSEAEPERSVFPVRNMMEVSMDEFYKNVDMKRGKAYTDSFTLYAYWDKNLEECENGLEPVERLTPREIVVEAEHGSFKLVQDWKVNGKALAIEHFAEKNGEDLDVIKVPQSLGGFTFRVESVPDSGFVLEDSITVSFGKNSLKVADGGKVHLTSDMRKNLSLSGEFALLDDTPIEFTDSKLYISGNAVKLNFTTSEFDVRGKINIHVAMLDAQGVVVVDSMLVSEVEKTPYLGEWEKYPLRAGYYLVRVTLKNRWNDTFVYEQDFEIQDRIIASEKDSWQMVSLNQVDFEKFAWDTSDVRFYWWDETSDYGEFWQYKRLEKGEKLAGGNRGYWYSTLEGTALNLKSALPEKIDGKWTLDSVYSGWNLVANPYGWYVDVCALNEALCGTRDKKPEVEFYGWNAETNSYEEVRYLKPHEAVWAKVSKPVTWNLPNVPSYVDIVNEEGETEVQSDLRKARSLEQPVNKRSWGIVANLRDASGKRSSWNRLGVDNESWNSEVPPQGMGDRVNFAVVDGNKSFIKSFRKASATDVYEWNVELNASSEREGYLSFDGVGALREMGLKLFVTIDGHTQEMGEGDEMKVLLKREASSATIRVAANPAKTLVYQLNGLRAVKVGAGLQVFFNASEGLAGATSRVSLMDLNGKIVSSVKSKTVRGENSVELVAPRAGLYVVHVKAGNKQQSGQILVK